MKVTRSKFPNGDGPGSAAIQQTEGDSAYEFFDSEEEAREYFSCPVACDPGERYACELGSVPYDDADDEYRWDQATVLDERIGSR